MKFKNPNPIIAEFFHSLRGIEGDFHDSWVKLRHDKLVSMLLGPSFDPYCTATCMALFCQSKAASVIVSERVGWPFTTSPKSSIEASRFMARRHSPMSSVACSPKM